MLYLFITATVLNTLLMHFRDRMIQDWTWEVEPLPDLLFSVTPHIKSYRMARLNDLIVLIPAAILLLNGNVSVCNEFFKVAAMLYFIRAFTLVLTILPAAAANTGCELGSFPYCTDYVMSGHTILSLVPLLVMAKYGVLANPYIIALFCLHTYHEVAKLCMRKHYSIDIFYATILCLLLVYR